MKNGFYAIDFGIPTGEGSGVLMLQDGILRGGDSSIFYVGNYTLDGDKLTADVVTYRHSGMLPSIFGRDTVHIALEGSFSGQGATLAGSAKEAPGVTLNVKLKRIGD